MQEGDDEEIPLVRDDVEPEFINVEMIHRCNEEDDEDEEEEWEEEGEDELSDMGSNICRLDEDLEEVEVRDDSDAS